MRLSVRVRPALPTWDYLLVKFDITAAHNQTKQLKRFVYDNTTSELTDGDGNPVNIDLDLSSKRWAESQVFSPDNPATKTNVIKKLKILLGLACNYSCDYCSQRFVPHAMDEGGVDDAQAFVESMDNWCTLSDDATIEFWGGEPLVYWKKLKPLAELLRVKYPQAQFSIVTNGSLLNAERNQWLDELGFSVAISHDGPGQSWRGPDPFQDDEIAWAIHDLYERLYPKNRILFSVMLHRNNYHRGEIQSWFQERFGDDVAIGEGLFVDAYDEGGLALLPSTQAEFYAIRRVLFDDIMAKRATRFMSVRHKIDDFLSAIKQARSASQVGQKCGMDRPDNIAVTLLGDVVTCQNVSPSAIAPNGQPHKIGDVSDLTSVALNTANHWQTRDECSKCPVLQLCKGGCMFLQDESWDRSCEAAFNDNIVFFCVAFSFATGYIPIHIDGPHPTRRHWVWKDK